MNTDATPPTNISTTQQRSKTLINRQSSLSFTAYALVLISCMGLIFFSLLGASYVKNLALNETVETITFILLFGSVGVAFIWAINKAAHLKKRGRTPPKKKLSSFSEKSNTYIANLNTMKGGHHTIENKTIPHSSKSLRENCSWRGFYHVL